MSDGVTVVWVAEAPQAAAQSEAARALDEWARARGIKLVPVEVGGGPVATRIDVSVGDRCEKELEHAREAIAALDADAAERALARADAQLRDHPELPQAAWLRAEVQRSWAARFSRVEPRDDARARAAWQEADALDGGRVVGVGELELGARRRLKTRVVVSGAASKNVVVRLDGIPLTGGTTAAGRTTYEIDVAPAEHQLTATLDGQTVFASWVAIAFPPPDSQAPPIELGLTRGGGVCAAGAFAGVSRADGAVRADGVACPQWVAAMPAERPGAILVSRCEGSTCGPLLEWRAERTTTTVLPQKPEAHAPWPGWATWAMVGTFVATAATVTLIAAGVFETRPTEPRFVGGGARVE